MSLPIDSVEAVQVFMHPYTAEYGQFTGGITRVYTREGGDHWHFELNDFLPDLRFVNGQVHGIAEDSPASERQRSARGRQAAAVPVDRV